MQRSSLIKIALFTIALIICTHGGSIGIKACLASDNDTLVDNFQPLRILDTIPQRGAGISTSTEVPDDTSFGVLIESRYGIDPADVESVRFEIDDGYHFVYERDLSSDTMRAVEVAGDDPGRNLMWVVYDRSLENQLPPIYFPDEIVHITVHALDIHENSLPSVQFHFRIEPDPGHSVEFDRLPDYDFVDSYDLLTETHYDTGMDILSGELAGAAILYDSNEPLTPGFGPVDAVEPLYSGGAEGVGEPLNLVPHTIFQTPVKVFIPFAKGTDLANMDIYYHNSVEWLRACDADGDVLPGGTGWMVAGSRVDHYETSPPMVEIQVYHFSSVQGFVSFRGSESVGSSGGTRTGSGGTAAIKCFVDAAAYDAINQQTFWILALFLLIGIIGLLPVIYSKQINLIEHFATLLSIDRVRHLCYILFTNLLKGKSEHMPAKNPRINVVLEDPLYKQVQFLAQKDGMSMSAKVRELLKEIIETQEDIHLAEIASAREAGWKDSESIPHKKVWS